MKLGREKSLIKNTLIITIGKICTQLITFFLLPLYTGILSTEEYGTVDLLNTLVSLLLPIVTFQTEQAMFRALIEARDHNWRKKKIISSGIISVIFQCFVYIVIFLLISPFIHNDYKFFLAINVIASIFSSLMLQIARGLGYNQKYAFGSFISALGTIIFNILFLVIIKLKVNGMLLATVLGNVVCTIYLFKSLSIHKYLFISSFRVKQVKKLWKYSIPLIPSAISWWIYSASDRLVVSMILGISQNGILSAANKFSGVYLTFYNIFNMSWTESISIHINDRDIVKYFNKMFNIILGLFISMAVGMIACMPFVYPIMINYKFQSGYGLVPISIIASLFNVVIGLIGALYFATKNTKAVANTTIVAAIINLISHFALIKFIGLYAAPLSTFLAYFVMCIYRFCDIKKRYFKIRIKRSIIAKTLLVLPIILVCYYINNLYLNLISLLIAIVFAWSLNKKSISVILNIIKKK